MPALGVGTVRFIAGAIPASCRFHEYIGAFDPMLLDEMLDRQIGIASARKAANDRVTHGSFLGS